MNSSIDEVAEALGELGQRHFPVASLTTYKVGGTAALFCRVDDVETLTRGRSNCPRFVDTIGGSWSGEQQPFCRFRICWNSRATR